MSCHCHQTVLNQAPTGPMEKVFGGGVRSHKGRSHAVRNRWSAPHASQPRHLGGGWRGWESDFEWVGHPLLEGGRSFRTPGSSPRRGKCRHWRVSTGVAALTARAALLNCADTAFSTASGARAGVGASLPGTPFSGRATGRGCLIVQVMRGAGGAAKARTRGGGIARGGAGLANSAAAGGDRRRRASTGDDWRREANSDRKATGREAPMVRLPKDLGAHGEGVVASDPSAADALGGATSSRGVDRLGAGSGANPAGRPLVLRRASRLYAAPALSARIEMGRAQPRP